MLRSDLRMASKWIYRRGVGLTFIKIKKGF
jgi:hypothetical protein